MDCGEMGSNFVFRSQLDRSRLKIVAGSMMHLACAEEIH